MSTVTTGYAVTTVSSLLLLALAWRWPRAGRSSFAVLFSGAALYNAVTAIRTPMAYVEGFGPHAITPMREFIERVVTLAPDAFVLSVAAGQLVVAVLLAVGRGWGFQLGVALAATFLVGISW